MYLHFGLEAEWVSLNAACSIVDFRVLRCKSSTLQTMMMRHMYTYTQSGVGECEISKAIQACIPNIIGGEGSVTFSSHTLHT